MKRVFLIFILILACFVTYAVDVDKDMFTVYNSVVQIRMSSETRMKIISGREFYFGMAGGQMISRIVEREPKDWYTTGFAISRDGYILTLSKPLKKAEKIYVKTYDNREFGAKLIGTDPILGIALIKVDDRDFEPLEFGDISGVKLIDEVNAVGYPGKMSITTTGGIISATKRTGMGATHFESYIQTDVALSPGMEGGPLLNSDYKVIGICLWSIAEGIGFTLPVDKRLKNSVEKIKNKQEIEYTWTGISIKFPTPEEVDEFSIESANNIMVRFIVPGSPAANSNILPGDIIVSVDGVVFTEPVDIQNYILSKAVSSPIKFKIKTAETEEREVVLNIAKRPQKIRLSLEDEVYRYFGFRFDTAEKPIKGARIEITRVDYGTAAYYSVFKDHKYIKAIYPITKYPVIKEEDLSRKKGHGISIPVVKIKKKEKLLEQLELAFMDDRYFIFFLGYGYMNSEGEEFRARIRIPFTI